MGPPNRKTTREMLRASCVCRGLVRSTVVTYRMMRAFEGKRVIYDGAANNSTAQERGIALFRGGKQQRVTLREGSGSIHVQLRFCVLPLSHNPPSCLASDLAL